ncbi:type II secretion system protein N [Sphingomonas sp. BIUV-7]|uniref:Type II secretion system protein N n=1 Tax=Sphingomonas natans TaxID=3063330 RepID=A0ABT8Y5L4_9SPHN|nr:type II secretion system protein N [Sphingomonas sp. BIUV-7]MDO6413613.1 type II secretion system protein N [Sphingomonas sp. BIUV-7]
MTPRQARLGANLFTALVAASVGVALAGTTWRLLGDPGQRLGATPVAARPAPPPDIATLVGLSPFGTAAPIAGAADTNVILRGILLAVPRSASSALISVGGATPVAFYTGSQVAGGTIDEIAADHVVIATGSDRRLLAFPDRAGTGPATAATSAPTVSVAPPAPSPPPGPSGPAPAANPQTLLAGLGATPAADGFHVNTPSLQMKMAGLAPGDVVQRVNGMAMAELMTNPAALQTAFTNGTARVDLVRAGQPLTLSVPLR